MLLLSGREKHQDKGIPSQRSSRLPCFPEVSTQLRGTPHTSKSSPFSGTVAASSLRQKRCMSQNRQSSTRETTGRVTGRIVPPPFMS